MKAIIFIFITLCLISGQVLCFKVSGCTGGSLMFKCMYKSSHKTDDRHKGAYFCRDRDCNTDIRTNVQNHWTNNGRFSLYDDEKRGFITVFIRNLSSEDNGKYTCGNKKWSHDVELQVKKSRCGKSAIQNGFVGKTITFRCEYEQKFKTLTKVVYRLNGGDPELMMNSNSRSSPSSEEKILLSDSQRDHFNVTITSVSEDDHDRVYLCGVERLGSRWSSPTHTTFIKEIRVNVSMPPVVGREGDSVLIRCPYEQKYSGEVKFLYKGKCFTEEARIVGRSDKDYVKNTNISVNYDTRLGLFIVNLTDLRTEDAGIYCCPVKDCKEKKKNLPIELMIITKDMVTAEASVGGSVSISCKHSTDQSLRVFCRGDQPNVCVRDGVKVTSDQLTNERFSVTDRSSFTVSISRLTAEDSGKYWCAEERSGSFILTEVHLNVRGENTSSVNNTEKPGETQPFSSVLPVIATVPVGLILLTVCLALLLFKRKHSRKASDASPDRRETADTRDSDSASIPLYSTIQSPQTQDSDPTSTDLYSTVQLPQTQDSDPASIPLYSTVQSPTVPSDGLMYATVGFQKNEESVSDAKVTLNKEEIHCEYASVNQGITAN